MSTKKVALLAGGIFLVIVALAVCVSAKFNLTSITSDPYTFILSFFSQWSSPLSAFAVVVASVLAFIAIREGRRSQRITMLDQQLYKLEAWSDDNIELLTTFKYVIRGAESESKRRQELESHKKEFESQYKIIEEKIKKLGDDVDTDTEEIRQERINLRDKLVKIGEDLIENNTELIEIFKRSKDYIELRTDEIIKLAIKLVQSELRVESILQSINDSELSTYVSSYYKLVPKIIELLEQQLEETSIELFEKSIDDISQVMKDLVACIHRYRNKMTSR